MSILLDACAFINLFNGNCLDKIVLGSGHLFFVGEATFNQEILSQVQRVVLEEMVARGQIILLASKVTLTEILAIRAKYNIGLGEAECIVLSKSTGQRICTDDNKAKKSAEMELGSSSAFGTLKLLKECVASELILCEEAILSYNRMLDAGGYLPKNLSEDYFCS